MLKLCEKYYKLQFFAINMMNKSHLKMLVKSLKFDSINKNHDKQYRMKKILHKFIHQYTVGSTLN